MAQRCDREDYVEDQEIKLENKEERLNQLETLKEREQKSEPEKDRLKRTKTVSYLTGRTEDRKSKSVLQELREQEEAIAETASKPAG